MKPKWAEELPFQKDAYIGYCPICDDPDKLLFLLRYGDGSLWEFAMGCGHEWKLEKN